VLYLRWQEKFHNAGSSLDARGLSADLRDLSSVATRDVVSAALWLLGFYAGCERVMPLRYATESPTPAWFHGRSVHVEFFEGRGSERLADPPVTEGSLPTANSCGPAGPAPEGDAIAHSSQTSASATESVTETGASVVQPVQPDGHAGADEVSGARDSSIEDDGAEECGAEPSEPDKASPTAAALQAAAAKPRTKSSPGDEGDFFEKSNVDVTTKIGDDDRAVGPRAPGGKDGVQNQGETEGRSEDPGQSQDESNNKGAGSGSKGGGKRGSSQRAKRPAPRKKAKSASGK
jgi:hypothetical protein